MTPTLTDREKHILLLAGRQYVYEANREADVWDELGLTIFPFWQQVRRLVVTERAQAHSPLVCSRLRRRMAA